MVKYNVYIKEDKKTIDYLNSFCKILYISIINNGYLVETDNKNELKFKVEGINSFLKII